MNTVDVLEIRRAIVLQATRKLCKVHVNSRRVVDVQVAEGILQVRFVGDHSWQAVSEVTIDQCKEHEGVSDASSHCRMPNSSTVTRSRDYS